MKALMDGGVKVELGGNRPKLLDDSDKIWVVETGRIEVFAVKLEAGKPYGRRHHLFTANPGDALWGVSFEKHQKEAVLLATALPESSLIELSFAGVRRALHNGKKNKQALSLFDTWTRNTVNGLASRTIPKRYVSLEESGTISLRKGESALRKNGVLWIKRHKGEMAFLGNPDNTYGIDTIYFPVTGYGCIQAREETVLEAKSSESLEPEDLFSAIDGYNAWLMRTVSSFITNLDRREASLMHKRSKQDERILQRSVRGLSEVMRSANDLQPWALGTADPLLAACMAVGKAARIRIKAPPADRTDLDAIADASRTRTRQVLLDDQWWRSDCGPLLGFLAEGNRPVALLPKTKRQYEIYDPISGRRILVRPEVARTLKPFAYSFYRPFPERPLGPYDLFRAGLQECWSSDFWSMLLAGVLGGLLGIVVPVATGFIFNNIIPQADRQQLLQLGLFLLVSAVSSLVFQIARSTALLRIQTGMNISIQAAVWDRLLSLPLSFFRKYTTGDLATRAEAINAIRDIFSGTVLNSIFTGIFSLFNFVLLFFYSTYLAWRAALLIVISLAVTTTCGWLILRYQNQIAEIGGKLNGLILQVILGISKFRISGSEKRAYYLWSRNFAAKRKAQFKAESVLNVFATWNAVFPIAASIWLYYLIVQSVRVNLPIGNFLAFNAAFVNFSSALLSLSSTLIGSTLIVPLYKRLSPILTTMPEHDETKQDPGELNGDIEIAHVNFRYDPQGPVILEDVAVNVRQGEFVAVVGPSGSGKSTLMRLLLGFETPESGAIYYDGQDLSTLDIRAVRSQIGVVLQNSKLMSGDIFSNITGASANLSVQDAWEAAEMAGIAADIKEMPMGMYTYIAEGGATLSGGQRQRILIARAIVNKPRILFFDEATSALDNKTQEIVSRSLTNLNTTRIVIAHRLSTIVNADRIVVVSKGKIVQEGTYLQLEKESGPFAELAKRQLA
jgi:NHLM bacteriocin system ABC transporter ATP-binding protein